MRRTPSAETDAFSRLGHVAALSSLLWTVLLVTGWQLPLRLAGDLPFEWEWTVKLAIRERTAPWFFPFFHDVLGSGPAEGRLWLYPALAVAAALVVRWSAAPPPAVRALLEWPAALYGFAALTALGPWALTVWPVTVVMVLLSLVVLPRRHR
ncbi:hypothetical protein [Streptomyces sp. NPDC018610]|uniref:hypothetical protein n=1 Tax=Streptomyces sp. NPDC018610 TaxID=3365049 RepID=UPI0037AB9216